VTFDRHGVTRDARERTVEIYGKKAVLIDSPGMFDYAEYNSDVSLLAAISKKLGELVDSADLIIFVLDGMTGITEYDRDIANFIRKTGKEIIVTVNKSERKDSEYSYVSATEFGFSRVYRISAEHGIGIDELLESIFENIPAESEILEEDTESQNVVKLAIIGRPNVGKSTLINVMLGEERQLVADYAGLTRESAEFTFEHSGRTIRLVDTAGIRRKSRVFDILEKISVSNSRKSYRNADAVILLIDATTLESGKIDRQDLVLAADILKRGKALVIAFNKVDKTPYNPDDHPQFLRRHFRSSLSQLKDVPFLFVSALHRENIDEMLGTVISIYDQQKIKIKTADLNEWLREVSQSGLMQSSSARFKLKYITQIGVLPPKFLVFVTNEDKIRDDHKRFIINSFRDTFEIRETAVEMLFRETSPGQHRNRPESSRE
jgi:GTP-binding protein